MAMAASGNTLGIRSNAQMFEEMGNPWDRGREPVGYVDKPETPMARALDKILLDAGKPGNHFPAETRERYKTAPNPEFDALFAPKADKRFDLGSDKGRAIEASTQRKAAAILAAARMKKSGKSMKEVKEMATELRPVLQQLALHANTNGRTGVFYSIFVRYEDGTEEEFDRRGLVAAETSFKRYQARKDTVCVELWSYSSGDILHKYDRKPEPCPKKP